MKHPSPQKQSSSFFVVNFGVLFSVLILLIVLGLPLSGFGQRARTRPKRVDTLQAKFGLNKEQLNQLLPFIGKQAGSLQRTYSKYSERANINYSPFWIEDDIWSDLERNRQVLARHLYPNLTIQQYNALRAAYLELEKKTLLLLLDEQLPNWCDDLEITNEQYDDIYDIVSRDITKKQVLMNGAFAGLNVSFSTIKSVSDDTEKKIWIELFPEQRRVYKKNKQKTQDAAGTLRG
jgi:hypothetical protein